MNKIITKKLSELEPVSEEEIARIEAISDDEINNPKLISPTHN